MIILGLDLATVTGWCSGETGSTPSIGSLTLPQTGPEIGPFMDFYDRWLIWKLEGDKPDLIVYEAPFVDQKTMNVSTTRKLNALGSHLELIAHRQKIEIREVANSTIKKALGHGRMQKNDMMSAARRCGLQPVTHDEADAFGAWLCGVRDRVPGDAAIWDQKLSTGLV